MVYGKIFVGDEISNFCSKSSGSYELNKGVEIEHHLILHKSDSLQVKSLHINMNMELFKLIPSHYW